MTIRVFSGPTLGATDVRAALDAAELVVSGPASFGDICRAAEARPTAIVLIDGYFERVPAVWHKEILWAMSEGIHVFGASSMGALRAAELADFGMVGVGSIYEAFRDGQLEDDDEVALIHGTADTGFAPLSEAMVNIRATVAAAAAATVLSAPTAAALCRIAKARFYPNRVYPGILADAESEAVAPSELHAFREWLPGGRVNQKREDALLLLAHVRKWLASAPPPKQVSFRFAPTDAWQEARRLALTSSSVEDPTALRGDEALIEELKLTGGYAAVYDAAVARGAAIEEARRAAVQLDRAAMQNALEDLRREHGLARRDDFEQWRAEQRLDDNTMTRFLSDHARVLWARPLTDALARRVLVDQLRAAGDYGRLAAKAEEKTRRLGQTGAPFPSLQSVGFGESKLWDWYFGEYLKRDVPKDIDRAARSLGFHGVDEMRQAVVRELYDRMQNLS